MKEKLNNLNKEDLVEILERIYEVHKKDVEYYQIKEDLLLYNLHQTRLDRIEQYINSALRKNKIKNN